MITGKCYVKGCPKVVPSEMLMCYQHWKMVPQDGQRKVWNKFRKYGPLSPEWKQAADEAEASVIARSNRKLGAQPRIQGWGSTDG